MLPASAAGLQCEAIKDMHRRSTCVATRAAAEPTAASTGNIAVHGRRTQEIACVHYASVANGTLQRADAWFASLANRLTAILDNATYSVSGCVRSGGVWRGESRCHNASAFAVEAAQPRSGFARFDFLQPLPACTLNYVQGTSQGSRLHATTRTHLGRRRRDGGKWLCDAGLRQRTLSGGVVISLGSNNQFEFEQSMVAFGGTSVAIHTFDCTVAQPAVPAEIRRHVTFHRTCLGDFDGRDAAGRRFVRWRTLLAELGFPTVSLLKLDIEGHERRALWDMLAGESTGAGSAAAVPRNLNLPAQIAVELHSNMLQADGYDSHRGRRMSTIGELAMLATLWHTRGYVLAHREDNVGAARVNGVADSTELLLLRARCPGSAARRS